MFEVVTSMNQKYYDHVGKRMVDSFIENWTNNISLLVYAEDDLNISNKKIIMKSLFDEEPELKKFIERNKDRPRQMSENELHFGAVRFSYKTFSIINSLLKSKSDYVIWLDADVYTHSFIDEKFLQTLVDKERFLTYLGRENNYSECGFVIYNRNHKVCQIFAETWKRLYVTDDLFKLPQWHDSFVFDVLRKEIEKSMGVVNYNLTPEGKNYDHVFINSILGEYMDHLKGPRKDSGSSKKSDLYTIRNSEYWGAVN